MQVGDCGCGGVVGTGQVASVAQLEVAHRTPAYFPLSGTYWQADTQMRGKVRNTIPDVSRRKGDVVWDTNKCLPPRTGLCVLTRSFSSRIHTSHQHPRQTPIGFVIEPEEFMLWFEWTGRVWEQPAPFWKDTWQTWTWLRVCPADAARSRITKAVWHQSVQTREAAGQAFGEQTETSGSLRIKLH